jgi:iron complex transport system ATP-binding protein
MNNSPTALSTRDLTFSYHHKNGKNHGGTKILDGLTIGITPGEFTGILGPNGSGKTTLLKNLLSYLKADSGSISLYGRPQSNYSSREISENMSLVPQKSGGGAFLSVYEMILLGRLVHMENRWNGYSERDYAIVNHVIHVLDLEHFRNRSCHSLSGGEFQKVLLARALVQQSGILLLDEATANLDLRHAAEIMDLVRKQCSKGKTIVAVMHDLNLAARYCDRVIFMKNGRGLYSGAPTEIYRREIIREIYEIDAYISVDDEGVPFVLPKRRVSYREEQLTREVV